MMLADFGAEVIKIEEPLEGDYARNFPPFQNGFGKKKQGHVRPPPRPIDRKEAQTGSRQIIKA